MGQLHCLKHIFLPSPFIVGLKVSVLMLMVMSPVMGVVVLVGEDSVVLMEMVMFVLVFVFVNMEIGLIVLMLVIMGMLVILFMMMFVVMVMMMVMILVTRLGIVVMRLETAVHLQVISSLSSVNSFQICCCLHHLCSSLSRSAPVIVIVE